MRIKCMQINRRWYSRYHRDKFLWTKQMSFFPNTYVNCWCAELKLKDIFWCMRSTTSLMEAFLYSDSIYPERIVHSWLCMKIQSKSKSKIALYSWICDLGMYSSSGFYCCEVTAWTWQLFLMKAFNWESLTLSVV